ncbi:DeoR/GlpR family DNA-binding transcription regulator [Streptobacillus canis]|uniref:DeoR/GlpR family DNA-binding transcription regulator n=1 Tax=Streptobacillus canis TaxID=2678686 RepID=UPI0012E0CDBD|nr:DeoR/GlpR family DNA-binding transcription regulator [Streptobacillus canis]
MKSIRKDKIMEIIFKKKFVTIHELSKELNVVPITIRRDLEALSNEGKLIKIHGGAKLKSYIENEFDYLEKKEKNEDEKIEIAKKAASLITNNDIIYIGPGTTTEKILEYIENKNVTVITNSMVIIQKYANLPNIELIILGGIFKKKSKAILPYLFENFANILNVNKVFIGTNGIFENKVTYSDISEGKIEEIMINNSIESYILLDNSKFDKKSFFSFDMKNKKINLITDSKISKELIIKYSKYFNILD